mgnify:CR=1 FL=1
MQLIECPWCGPREETEFHYGGQAHVAYPDDPAALTDEQWAHYVFFRGQPQGRCSPSGGATAPDAAAGSTPCATPPPTDSTASTAWASRSR